MNPAIALSEKLYVLGIHPEKGGIISSSYTAMDYILIGGLLLELNQERCIKFEDKRIIVLNSGSDNKLHRLLLTKLGSSRKPLKIARWINKLNFSRKNIRKEIQQSLVAKRVIRLQPKRFLFFRWQKPVLLKKQLASKLISEIDRVIYRGSTSEDDILLISMLKPAGLLKRIYPDLQKRKNANRKLKLTLVENPVSGAVADAISAARAVAASVGATTAVTAGS